MQKLAMAASSAALIALAGPLLAEPQAEVLHAGEVKGQPNAESQDEDDEVVV